MQKIIKTSIIVIILLTFIQIIVSNTLSTTGVTLGKLEDQITYYDKENQVLKENLLAESSFAVLFSKAQNLGFIPEKSNVVLSNSLPLALKP